MLHNEKVSVIVPIYKVEKYIHRCIESILNQTYTNLEVILVNDGSPDNCGDIIDNYEKKDTRVKIIHKQNGGLSDARNAGMKIASGDFVVFVDSDDWIENNMIESMVQAMKHYEADIVQSAFYYAYEDKRLIDNRYYSTKDEPVILDNKSLMYELVINEKVKNFAWGKLYKTNLIKNIPFKKGVLFEDVFWAHRVMHSVNTYVIMHDPLYNYFQRDDGIVAKYSPKNMDILIGLKERHQFLEKFYPNLKEESFKLILKTSLIHYNLLLFNRKKIQNNRYRKDLQKYINDNYINFKKAAENDKALLVHLKLFRVSPYLNILYLSIRKLLLIARILPKPVGLEKE